MVAAHIKRAGGGASEQPHTDSAMELGLDDEGSSTFLSVDPDAHISSLQRRDHVADPAIARELGGVLLNRAAKTAAIYSVPRIGETATGKYIGGKYIELGFRTNDEIGKMAAEGIPPANFHGRTSDLPGIGVVANAGAFGPTTDAFTIDYVMANEDPEEGFYMGYVKSDGTKDACKNCGLNVTVRKEGKMAIAETFAQRGDLKAYIQVSLEVDKKVFRTDVRLENIGTDDMTSVRFMRALNPDNTADQGNHSAKDGKETFMTLGHSASSQSVSASSKIGDPYFTSASDQTAKLVLYTTDALGVASHGHLDSAPKGLFDTEVYESPPGPVAGGHPAADTWVSMCFQFPTLAPGATVDLTYFTGVSCAEQTEMLTSMDGIAANTRGFCDRHSCPKTHKVKPHGPVTCTGAECKVEECCDAKAMCATLNCSLGGDFLLKDGHEKLHCADTTCKYNPVKVEHPDLDACCDQRCSSFDEDDCPHTRKSNPCRVYNSDCEATCESRPESDCPSLSPSDPCIKEDGKCHSKGFCKRDHVCTAGTVLKEHFEPFCNSTTCEDAECCGPQGECPHVEAESICGEHLTMKPVGTLMPCAKTECTEEECCDHAVSLSAGSERRPELHGKHEVHPANLREQARMESGPQNLIRRDKASTNFDVPRLGSTSNGKFIGGKYIELGFRTNNQVGKMGTDDVASGFNGRKPGGWRNGVGMTANANGFAGSQDATIDYFLPGCPEEGFYMGYKIGGATTSGKNCANADIETRIDGDEAKAITVAVRGDLKVTQEITLKVTDTFFRNDVKIENTGTSTMTDVRFMRSHDPDNTVDQAGWRGYSTHQTREVVTDPAGANAVSAESKSGDTYHTATGATARVIYYTKDPLGVASYGQWGLAPSSLYHEWVWDSPPALGSTKTADAFISMCVKYDTLGAGQSKDFTYWTALDDIPTVDSIEAIADADSVAPGFCADLPCPTGHQAMDFPPVICEGNPCIVSECCDELPKCTSMQCNQFGTFLLKTDVGATNCGSIPCGLDDRGTCCEEECYSFDEQTCPLGRGGNRCGVYKGDCKTNCEMHSTNECEHHDNCVMDGACKGRSSCSRQHNCPAGQAVFAVLDNYCAGAACVDADCCGVLASCPTSAANTICTSGQDPKLDGGQCQGTECTEEECCIPRQYDDRCEPFSECPPESEGGAGGR